MKFQNENSIVLPDLHLLAACLIPSTPSPFSQNGMNISILLNIDDLGTNIASALRTNPDIESVSLDPGSPSNSWVLKGRPYLHPMTNIDPSPLHHPDSWDIPSRPLIIKPWLGKPSPNGYETLPDATTTTHVDAFDPLPELAYHSPIPADVAKLELLAEHSSPYQSFDEDWRTYLSDEPFSNGMDDFDLDEAGNPLELVYPPEETEDANRSDDFVSEQLSFSAVPNFRPHSPVSLLDSLPLAEHSSPTISTGSRPLLVFPSPEQSLTIDLQENTPRRNETVCIPNGTYASLMELTPPAFDFGSARFSSLEAPSRPSTESVNVSPASSPAHPPQRRGRSPTVARRGLSGWGESQYLQVPTPSVIGGCRKRVRSPTNSPCSSLRRPYAMSPLDSIRDSEETSSKTSSTHDSKRSKTSEGSSLSLGSVIDAEVVDPESEADELIADDDSDSDDYRPSRSSSVDLGMDSSFSAALPLLPKVLPVPLKQKSTSTRRGKGKAKGSAALALAVVTQLGAARSRVKSEPSDGDDYDPLTLYREGRYGIRKRKNNPIPLPVPVPNLNKKSRGRKVPYVAGAIKIEDRSPSAEASTEDQGSASSASVIADTDTRDTGRSRRKLARAPTPVASIDPAGNRTYVCAVAGCGKGFVRGEHLKRHVRSIHTYDKRKFTIYFVPFIIYSRFVDRDFPFRSASLPLPRLR